MNHTSNINKDWTKMSGAGNTFLISHTVKALPQDGKKISQTLCQQYQTQGLVILKVPSRPDQHFQWAFYNADGSSAEMCGNAACCVIEYIFKKQLCLKSPIIIKTKAGLVKGLFQKNHGSVLFLPAPIQGPFTATFDKRTFSYWFVKAFVPHAVIKQDFSIFKKSLMNNKKCAKKLRHIRKHHPAGMNVSFYSPLPSTIKDSQFNKHDSPSLPKLQAVTFERGVEDFTPACGTGAVAIAQVEKLHNKTPIRTVIVKMPKGSLKVHFGPHNTISLESPVQWHPLATQQPTKTSNPQVAHSHNSQRIKK